MTGKGDRLVGDEETNTIEGSGVAPFPRAPACTGTARPLVLPSVVWMRDGPPPVQGLTSSSPLTSSWRINGSKRSSLMRGPAPNPRLRRLRLPLLLQHLVPTTTIRSNNHNLRPLMPRIRVHSSPMPLPRLLLLQSQAQLNSKLGHRFSHSSESLC